MSGSTTNYTLGRIGLNIRGTYDAEETYAELDVVHYQRSSYVARQTTINVTPGENDNWTLLEQGLPVKSIDYATELPTTGTEGQILFVPLS